MPIRSRRTFLESGERERVERFLRKTSKDCIEDDDKQHRRTYRKTVLPVLVAAFLSLLLVSYTIFSFSHQQPEAGRNLSLERKGDNVDKMPLSPFTSEPPEAVRLDMEGHQRARHQCLQSIRQRHESSLRKFVDEAASVLLVDPAYHSNVGDHMITLGELEFLEHKTTTSSPPLSQCSYIQAADYVSPCKETIAASFNRTLPSPPHWAVWHGGGNWGTLWPRAQKPRVESFVTLLQAGYSIVTMPNSWYYQDDESEKEDVQRIRKNIAEGLAVNVTSIQLPSDQQIVFTWREQFSYDMAVRNFPFVTNLLVPDIAFQLGPYQSTQIPEVDLLLLLRDDHESLLTSERSRVAFRRILDSVPEAKDLSFSLVDWPDRLHRFHSSDIFFTETALDLLGLGRVVICDRLHAAILAYLAGMPFVYLDQVSGKISKTLSVATDGCPNDDTWLRASNLTEAVELSMRLLAPSSLIRPSRHERRNRLRHQLSQAKE